MRRKATLIVEWTLATALALALTDMVVEALFVAVMGYFGGLVAGALTGSALAWTRWDFAVPEPAA